MAKVVGIGGVFLQFKGEKKEVQNWYNEFMGLDMTEYGTGFYEGEQLVLLSFKRSNENSPFINLRVDDIDAMFKKFVDNSIEIVDDIKRYDYGKFGQFKDPFGNIIELWEPFTDKYIEMVKKEIVQYKKGKL
ncbi:Glyoxalase-like domain protein [Candidatus Izimaplasma bacterium HR1]|jgi:uncharacterized glyoxalase superfamily protein PhnB|uniref:VOC family protein n=1 Tax=Candidatus Izimoplasma sp. HR1 TaxID=1541959 RepID=UPI0004F5D16B|nr:Glyoxalase-like domain protein [Candidatus Izimaplasma bacterium HR1]